MKKLIISFSVALLSVFTILLVPATASAAGEVTYEGNAEGFVFSPGSPDSPTNLFGNLDKVVPGDVLTENIEIKNNSSKSVKLYIQPIGADESVRRFLSKLNLKISKPDGTEIFNDSPGESLSDPVLLGNMEPGYTETLKVVLSVPLDMDDSFQNSKESFEWRFIAQEQETETETTTTTVATVPAEPSDPTVPTETTVITNEPKKTDTPDTGDKNNVIVFAVVAAAMSAGMIVTVLITKKNKTHSKR